MDTRVVVEATKEVEEVTKGVEGAGMTAGVEDTAVAEEGMTVGAEGMAAAAAEGTTAVVAAAAGGSEFFGNGTVLCLCHARGVVGYGGRFQIC